jgi:dihydroflavonol-4-reductase
MHDKRREHPGWETRRMLMTTGATGYLGSALVDLLVRSGHDVRAVVRDRARATALLPPDVDLVVADLADPDGLRRAARGCDAVLHLAGSVGGTPEDIRRANVDGTRAVLAAVLDAGVPRFVHTGTSAAVMDASGLVAECPSGPPALTDPYSTAKAEAEDVVLAAAADGLDVRIVSPVSIYGPSPLGPYSYNALLIGAARGEVPEVVDATVGWVLADDVAAGLVLVLERGESGQRYVLCGEAAPYSRMLHDFADLTADLTGGKHVRTLPPGSTLGPDAGTFARRSEVYGGFPPVHVDDARARALGFDPAGIDEGLARTAAWLRTL